MDANDPLYIDPDDVELMTARKQAASALDLVLRLRELRERRGLRQKDVAEMMGRDPAVVSNLERLGSDPRWSSIQRYATALGVVLDYGFDAVDEVAPEQVRRAARALATNTDSDVDIRSVARKRVASQ